MDPRRISMLVAGVALVGATAGFAHGLPEVAGTFVGIAVEVDGREARLYPAPDGSGRYYLEARAGSRYSVALANRSGERLGVVLTVDGLNAISGARDAGRSRMYVLDPWQSTSVQGWRTSLQEVRQFTFVDERRSYAARTGQANEKMGWIEVAVYRERRPFVRAVPRPQPLPYPYAEPARDHSDEGEARRERNQAPAAPEAGPAREEAGATASGESDAKLEKRSARARSYPGTGWGDRAHDPVVLVSFDPQPEPSERLTLRYEYRSALVALGVLPPRVTSRDRLWQREHAEPGFAQPPRW